ncbi:MAG: hypothetical protein IKO88_05910 [Bacteroidales bacterium]|nr:hypothetical protein [Bacteroidales bacterium]
MKKIYIVLAVAATAMLSSCAEREMSFNDITLAENELSFSLGGVDTKSADVQPVAVKGVSIPISDDGMGNGISLEETIEDLNPSPATKGAPAYTINVGTLYKTMGVYATQGNFGGDATFEVIDLYPNKDPNLDNTVTGNKGWRYNHKYSGRPWPDDDKEKVDFYLHMPASPTGVEFTSRTDKQTKFSFTSPKTGTAQQDILFSQASYSKADHDGYFNNGAPVLMYHALTGVKFRNGHSNDGSTKTIIKSVKFTGIKSTGICTIDLSADEKVVWEGLDDLATFTMDFSSLNPSFVVPDENGNYKSYTDSEGNVRYEEVEEGESGSYSLNPDDGTVSYGDKEGEITTYNGTSWTAAAADHNLNDEDGSFTFWFIPQLVDESATLEITFLVKTPDTPDGTEVPHIIKFGELANADWKAGQLRTYTLKPFDVDVEIFDKMTNLTKDNLHVTNTGNVDEYVRIMVIGNWYGWATAKDKSDGKEPMILVGYEKQDSNDDTMVEPWYRENPVYAAGFDETFPGGRPLASSHWKRGTGSYFYYDKVIGAGQQLSGTDAVFQHYELDEDMIPTIWLPVANSTTRQAAVGVHLVMEVVVQAIPTTKPDGTAFATCWEAWSYAVGKEIKAK